MSTKFNSSAKPCTEEARAAGETVLPRSCYRCGLGPCTSRPAAVTPPTSQANKPVTVAVPWGEFRALASGALIWNHNPLLAMTRDEQYRQNVLNGFIKAAPVESNVLPPLPVGEHEHTERGLNNGWTWRSFSAEQVHAHGRECWTAGLDYGMAHAPAADETTLPDLARLLGAASKEGKTVKLSAVAAGTLYNAMTTRPASIVGTSPLHVPEHEAHVYTDEDLRQLKAEARAKAADGGNWSMDVGCMFVLAMIERIEAGAVSAPAPAAPNHAAEMDLARRIGMLLATTTVIDPVTAGKVAVDIVKLLPQPSQKKDATAYAEDPVDIIRTLLCTVDHYWSLPDDKREYYPSPTAELSPLMQAARRACVERGFTAGGLAIDPTSGSAT